MSAFDVTGETVTGAFPDVVVSHTISIPYDTMSYADKTEKVSTGTSIGIVNSGQIDFGNGVTGDGVTGEFVTLDGATFSQFASIPDRLALTIRTLRVSAGSILRIPPVNILITESRIEVGARRRKIKTSAIAS